jgi:hypothetical protein
MTLALQLLSFSSILAGMIMLNERVRAGWLVYQLSGVCLIWLYARTGLYVLIIAQATFMAFNLRGWLRWGRKVV